MITKEKEVQEEVAKFLTSDEAAVFGIENQKPQPNIEPSEKNFPSSYQAICVSPKTLGWTFAESGSGNFDTLPKSGEKRPGSLGVRSSRPVKRRQALCAHPFGRSPNPRKYRISSSLWSPYGEEQAMAGLSSPANVSADGPGDSTPPPRHDRPSTSGKKSSKVRHTKIVQYPSLEVLQEKWDGYSGANGEGVRSCTDGTNHDISSSCAGNQAGTITHTTSLGTASSISGGTELRGCGRDDDDDPRKPSKPYLESTHNESASEASSPVPSDDEEETRRKVAVRKGKRRMSNNSIPILDRDLSDEDGGDLDDMYDAGRDMTLSDQAASADFSRLSNFLPSNASEASQPGLIASTACLANSISPFDGVTIDMMSTGNWRVDPLDALAAVSPPRAQVNEDGRLRRHSMATLVYEESAHSAQPARSSSMLERCLEYGHTRAATSYSSVTLEGAGPQSGIPTSVELDGRVKTSIVPVADGVLGPIDVVPTGRVSEASELPSRDAPFPGPPGHRRHSGGRPLSCSVNYGAKYTTSENDRGRSRLCGLYASRADVCEESQSRRGWRRSEQVPASVVTEEPPAHPPWTDEKRPRYYLKRKIDPSVGYGPCPNSPRPSLCGVPCDKTQGDKSPVAEEMTVTFATPAEPAAVTLVHTPANAALMADHDDITAKRCEKALSPDPSAAATATAPRYQISDPPRSQLRDALPPVGADTQVVGGPQEGLVETSRQIASQIRGSDAGPGVGLRTTQVVDFAYNPSTVSRDIALPPVNRFSFDPDESWGLGISDAAMIHIERARCSSQTGPWDGSLVVTNRTAAPATEANTTAPESTTSEMMQNGDHASRRHAFTNTTNSRRSLISYLLPCLNRNDAETTRPSSLERGGPIGRRNFGSVSTTNEPARQSIYVPQRNRSSLCLSDSTPEAITVVGGNDDAHDASTDPSITGPWLTP